MALCIALFPPIWAILSPHFGVQVGAVALICAGVYAAAGNRTALAVPMTIDLTPDAEKYSEKMAEAMIEEGWQACLEAIRSAHSDHAEKAISAVSSKYDERLRLYRAGIKRWDTSVSVTMIVRSIK